MNCPPGAHLTGADGWIRCSADIRPAGRAKVCPFCGTHFVPDRGSAVVHVRACARRHGSVWNG